MPRAPNVVLAIVAVAACGGEAVAPPRAPIHQVDAPLVAQPVAVAAAQAVSKSKTEGLDDVLARLMPTLGTSGLTLRDPVVLLRDNLKVTNSTARAALLTAAYAALDRYQANASDAQQADVAAIRLTLDAVRVDDAASELTR